MYNSFCCAVKESETLTEAGSCKGEVEGAKLHKMAEIGSGGLKAVWSVNQENKIEGDLPLERICNLAL